jgi:hypothetical protein
MSRHIATPGRARVAVALGLSLVIGAGLAACNIVVDAGSYHVGAFDGSVVTDGSAVTVAEGGSGVDGSLATGGPDGGGQTDANSHLDGGTQGAEDGSEDCGTTPLPTTAAFQQLVNACVLASSCDPDLFTVNISQCVTDDYLSTYGSLACLASITSCADYYSCEATSVASSSQCTDTTSDTDVGSCSASGVALSCSYTGGFSSIANCAALGGTCAVYEETDGNGEAAGCLIGSCSETDDDLHCMGTAQIYTCVNGSAYGQTCPSASLCGVIGGVSSCYYQSSSCATPGATCSASQALSICAASKVSAGATNEILNYNCAASDLQCQTDDAGSGQCVSPGCQQSQCTESCDGTSIITFCVGGMAATYDCTTSGFSSCGQQTSGNVSYAFCEY